MPAEPSVISNTPTSAIPDPVLEKKRPWFKDLRSLDFLNGLKLRQLRDKENEGIENRNFTRQQQAQDLRNKILLENIALTNKLEVIKQEGATIDSSETSKIARDLMLKQQLEDKIFQNTVELRKMQGITPEQATNDARQLVLKMGVVPPQLDIATKENTLNEVKGAAPKSTELGQSKVTSAISDLGAKTAQSDLATAGFNAQMPGITNQVTAAQQAATLGSQATAEEASNKILGTSAIDPRAVVDASRAKVNSEIRRDTFLSDNPAANPGVNLPRGAGFESPAQTLIDLKTLNSDGGFSTNNYGATSALGLLPGFQTVKPKFRPIPGIKLDMQPTAP